MKKLATAALAAMIGIVPMAAIAPASAGSKPKGQAYYPQYRPGPYQGQVVRKGNNNNNMQGLGVGLLAGAAVGVGAGLLLARPAPPPPVYYAPAPVYIAPPPPPPVYYAAPPPPPPVYYGGWSEAHVQWCYSRYPRSYNPATNTFVGYDGFTYECVGPY